MGGDGGVVATNRKYMRGAGSACHTADNKRGGSASAIAEATVGASTSRGGSSITGGGSSTALMVIWIAGTELGEGAGVEVLMEKEWIEASEEKEAV